MNKRFSGAFPATARLFVVASAMLVAACSDSSGPRAVASLKVGSGNNQVGPAGSALPTPVTFTAVDDNGRGVSGVVVAFAVSAGGGSVAVERDTSDGSGNVTAQWTVGTTAGQAQTLTATVVSAASIAPAQATASVVAGASAALAGTTNSVIGRVGIPVGAVTVGVRDKYGNAVSASNVRVTVRLENATGTTLGGTTEARTDGSGTALFTNLSTTGKSGTVTLLFESDGLNAARISLVIGGGLPAKVTTVGNATLDAEALLSGPPVSAKVLDAFDNPVADATVAFAIEGNAIGSATTGNDGVATLSSWTVPQIGSYKLTASTPGAATSAQFTLNSRAVGTKTLVPLPSNPTSGGVAHALVLGVTAFDALGRPVPGAVLTWTLNGLTQDLTADGNGIATFTATLGTKAGNNAIVVRSSLTVSVTLNVQGLPDGLASAAPEKDSIDAPAGSTVTARFVLQDAFGNSIPGATTSGTIIPATSAPTAVTVTSDANGFVTLTTTLDQFAGVVDFALALSSKRTRVYSTAAQGSVRILSTAPCVRALNAGTTIPVTAYVFGANGRFAANVPVTWTPAAASGSVSSPIGPPSPQASIIANSIADGSSNVSWLMPAQLGTYSITAQGPAGYDLPTSVTLTCTVN